MIHATNIIRLVQEAQPGEIYNLAAQSHAQVNFKTSECTANSDAMGMLRLFGRIRVLKLGWNDETVVREMAQADLAIGRDAPIGKGA